MKNGFNYSRSTVNNIINNIDAIITETQADADLIEKFKGEAYFLRAFYYHQLVQRWAKDYEPGSADTDPGVPVVLIFDVTLLPPRASVQEVYDQILSDISQAKTNLSSITGLVNSTRITIDAVTALEAQVYLCMHRWNDAVTAAINAGTLSNTIFKLESGFNGYYVLSGTITVPEGSTLTIVHAIGSPFDGCK